MLEYIGAAISYTCQIFIILFIANEFGWVQIRRKKQNDETSSSKSTGSSSAISGGGTNANPLGSLFEKMGPMVESMMQGMQKSSQGPATGIREVGHEDDVPDQPSVKSLKKGKEEFTEEPTGDDGDIDLAKEMAGE